MRLYNLINCTDAVIEDCHGAYHVNTEQESNDYNLKYNGSMTANKLPVEVLNACSEAKRKLPIRSNVSVYSGTLHMRSISMPVRVYVPDLWY